jgi:hypothetical protein
MTLHPTVALWASHALAWRKVSAEEGRHRVWKRVAYATRYGKGVTLSEVLSLDQMQLNGFLEALSDLVKEENEANKPKR